MTTIHFYKSADILLKRIVCLICLTIGIITVLITEEMESARESEINLYRQGHEVPSKTENNKSRGRRRKQGNRGEV